MELPDEPDQSSPRRVDRSAGYPVSSNEPPERWPPPTCLGSLAPTSKHLNGQAEFAAGKKRSPEGRRGKGQCPRAGHDVGG
ncbi:hypothetical protein GUJ93_ZPchr0012g20285 [Zizania palustris]|uniref:Uncharacterized protein n=1 Tax=Zizania palustris TaxID=103762 RepID=A0A8J5WQU2_ZIZPA|nr:hypothetical protein GUJ93_ZPchr0012g20285 [Zizania palustris]